MAVQMTENMLKLLSFVDMKILKLIANWRNIIKEMEKVKKTKKLVICLCVSALMTILCAAALMTELALPAEALTSNDLVLYGNYPSDGTSSNPQRVQAISWLVLEASGDRALLLSEKVVDGGVPFHPVSEENQNDDYYSKHYYISWWSESPLRLFLNGSEYVESVSKDETEIVVTNPKNYAFYDTAFSTGEGNAIIKDTVDNSVKYQYSEYDKDKLTSLDNFPSGPDTEDKIFLLSYAEVDYSDPSSKPLANGRKYGFDSAISRSAERSDYALYEGATSNWYLRSPSRYAGSVPFINIAMKGAESSTNFYKTYVASGLRPAFRLNLKSLLFTSPGYDGKQPGVVTMLQEQKYSNTRIWLGDNYYRNVTPIKLTIATDNYKLTSADVTSGTVAPGDDIKLKVSYSGASTGTGYHLAAVVTSGDKALYYGQIKSLGTPEDASGTAEFTIPKLNEGEEVYVFVEGRNNNGSRQTDFASPPKLLSDNGRTDIEALPEVEESPAKLESITINPLELTVTEESNYQLTVSFTPYDAAVEEIEWSSGDPTVATVDANGLVTALKPGTATITATAKTSGKTNTHIVTVIEKPLEPGLILTPMAMTISKGVNADISVTFKDIDKQPLTWKSDDEKIATVDENGTVTAISEGKCWITATTEDGTYSAKCEVTVVAATQIHNGGGGSSGCNAGIPAVVTLLTLGSLIYIRSRKGK